MRDEIRKRIEAVRRGEVPEGYSMDRAMLYPDDWGTPVPLNTVLKENKARNDDLTFGKEDVLSVSGEQGVVNQMQLLGRSYAGESVAPYHVVETGDVVYTKSPLKENPYGIIKQNRGKAGIVSTLYAVYHCDNPITGQYLENYFSIDSFLNNYLKPLVKRGAKNDMKVNNEDVLLGRIPLPSIDEQQKINEVIAHFDQLIELKEKVVEELKQLKKTCLAKMFPREGEDVPELRSPGFTGSWEQRKLIEYLSQPVSDGPHETPQLVEEGVPFISVDAIIDNKIDFSRKRGNITEEYDLECRKKYSPQRDDVFIVKSGATVGKVAIVSTDSRFNIWSPLAAMRTNLSRMSPRFLYYILQTAQIQDEVIEKSKGGTQPNLSMRVLERFQIAAPTVHEQTSIAAYFDSLDTLITLHQCELEAEQQKKKALMQLLLTGLVRVKV